MLEVLEKRDKASKRTRGSSVLLRRRKASDWSIAGPWSVPFWEVVMPRFREDQSLQYFYCCFDLFQRRGIERLNKKCRLDSSQTSQEYRLQAQSGDLPSHGLVEPHLRPASTSTSSPTRSEIKLPPWRYQHQRRQKSHPPRPSAHWRPSIISS